MKHWLLIANIGLFSLLAHSQNEEVPSNFENVKNQLSPVAEDEGLLLGFYDGEHYRTYLFKVNDNGLVYDMNDANFLASPQLDGFHYFQQVSTESIAYNDEDNDDDDDDYGNFSCYDVSNKQIIFASDPLELYTNMYQIKLEEYQKKLADLKKFSGPKKEKYIDCSLDENSREEIEWIVPGFIQTSSHYWGYHGGAHGVYGALNTINNIGSHSTRILSNQLYDQKNNDQNWQDIKMKAYIKALTYNLDENDFSVSPYDPGDEPEHEYDLDSLEFNEIEPEFPISDYEDVYYRFIHDKGRLNLGVVFSAHAPYVISHTYELNGTVNAGPIQQKMIGYNGVDIDFGIDHIHQLSPKQNVIVILNNRSEDSETLVSFFSTATGKFIHSTTISGKPVMMEWCSQKHIVEWADALRDDFSKISDRIIE